MLTDEKYFHGSFDYLRLANNTVAQPILCKDFIIDPYQIYLARFYQADAILLMLSILDDQTYQSLAALADKLKMGILTEVSNEEELKRAVRLKANIVGINNRDLHDLSIDLNRTKKFAPQLAEEKLVISESGIYSHQQIRQLSNIAAAPLNYVGVFQHQDNSLLAEISHHLSLFAFQLHGNKTAADIQQLRALLPADCEIWQVVNIMQSLPCFNAKNIDRYLLDDGEGGTGKTFEMMLAGGLNADNCQQAAALGCIGLDFNSGAECQPGIKSCHKLQAIFAKLLNYR